ncbi:MYXO-CTERM sorting domain-containing protein [Streptomyces sp. NPDC048191]|uniref:MYXO-CTERM sorting domain-containing protein n=1 Tax=Streptomyces sp. NPDC048191 TaxID=3155484 RepID=UPI0033E35616
MPRSSPGCRAGSPCPGCACTTGPPPTAPGAGLPMGTWPVRRRTSSPAAGARCRR